MLRNACAGHEAITQTVTWAMYLLAQHPEWQVRLREEVRFTWKTSATLEGSNGSSPTPDLLTHEALSAMPWLGCVIYEAMRLLPSASRIARIGERATWVVLLPIMYLAIREFYRPCSAQRLKTSRSRPPLQKAALAHSTSRRALLCKSQSHSCTVTAASGMRPTSSDQSASKTASQLLVGTRCA